MNMKSKLPVATFPAINTPSAVEENEASMRGARAGAGVGKESPKGGGTPYSVGMPGPGYH